MPRNIFIIGPQCTGKTTLVQQLQSFYSGSSKTTESGLTVIHEVVREIMSTNHFSTADLKTERWIELQQCTIKAQADAEEALRKHWFISDRSVLDAVVYAQLYRGCSDILKETEEWRASVQRMKEGLVVLCEAGQRAWLSSDAVRVAFADVQQWEAMNEQFEALLAEEGIFYHVLSKHVVSMKERVEFVAERLLQ